MTEAQIREKIQNRLNELDLQELIFVDQLLNSVAAYLHKIKQPLRINNKHFTVDSLPSLKDSDFIGCFVDETDLSEKSEQLARSVLSQQKQV